MAAVGRGRGASVRVRMLKESRFSPSTLGPGRQPGGVRGSAPRGGNFTCFSTKKCNFLRYFCEIRGSGIPTSHTMLHLHLTLRSTAQLCTYTAVHHQAISPASKPYCRLVHVGAHSESARCATSVRTAMRSRSDAIERQTLTKTHKRGPRTTHTVNTH